MNNVCVSLDKPKFGWSNLRFQTEKEELILPLSYVDDVMQIFLDLFSQISERKMPVIAEFDAEGYDWDIVISMYGITIIEYLDDISFHFFDIDINDFCFSILNSFLTDFHSWLEFSFDYDYENSDLQKQKEKETKTKLEQLISNFVDWEEH